MPQDYFRALRDVALAINASLDPKDVLHKISEHTAQTMNCKASARKATTGFSASCCPAPLTASPPPTCAKAPWK